MPNPHMCVCVHGVMELHRRISIESQFSGPFSFAGPVAFIKYSCNLYRMPTPTYCNPLFTLDPAPLLERYHSLPTYVHMSEEREQSLNQYSYRFVPVPHNQPTMDSAVGNSLLGVEYSQSVTLPDLPCRGNIPG